MMIQLLPLKRLVIFIFKCIGLLLCCSGVYADMTFNWTIDPTSDTSYQFLTFLFGNVSSDLNCNATGGIGMGCTSLIPMLFSILNQGVFAIGSIVVTYVMFTTTASSAHEGEFLGKKNSSLWLPARVVGGMGFLLPTSSGYSILQIFIMKITLMGVMMANNIYGVLQAYVTTNDTTFANESNLGSSNISTQLEDSVIDIAQTIFPIQCCYAYFAALEPNGKTIPDGLGLTPPVGMSGPYFYYCPQSTSSTPSTSDTYFTYYYITDTANIDNQAQFACASAASSYSTSGANLCGSWSYTYTNNDETTKPLVALQSLELSLYSAAEQLAQSYIVNSKQCANSLDSCGGPTAQSAINQAIAQAITDVTADYIAGQVSQASSSSTANDWLNFPLNFYEWIAKSGSGSLSSSVPALNKAIKGGDSDAKTVLVSNVSGAQGGTGNDVEYQNFYKLMDTSSPFFDKTTIKNAVASALGSGKSTFTLKEPSSSRDIPGPVSYMYSVMKKMVQPNQEPLLTLAIFGQKLLSIALDLMMSSIIVGGVMVGVSAFCASQLSTFGVGLSTAIGGFIITLMLSFSILIPMGVMLGIYLPLMPVTIYAMGVLTWFMMVIESMAAGPIIALGLVAPGQDNLGKAQPSILMLFNIFLRPSLMILGMVFGAKMFDIFSLYFSQVMINGFAAIGEQAGFNAWYGLIFIIFWFFYGFSIVAVAQRCYSLIYILPDKVINWIGGSGGSSQSIEEDLGTMKDAANRGGEALKKELSNVASGMIQMSKDMDPGNKK
jgi:conjugal transfer/type IV secretion protein DotA/TraY